MAQAFLIVCVPVQHRWESSVAEMDQQLKHIVGDTIISAAFITYCGPLTAVYREALVKTWLESCRRADIAVSDGYTFIGTMTKKNEVTQKAGQTLLSYIFSICSGWLHS